MTAEIDKGAEGWGRETRANFLFCYSHRRRGKQLRSALRHGRLSSLLLISYNSGCLWTLNQARVSFQPNNTISRQNTFIDQPFL